MRRAGCLRPVGLLADAGIDAIVAAGMGMRPMAGFAEAGITVLYDAETPNVGDVAARAAAGELPAMGEEHACHHYGHPAPGARGIRRGGAGARAYR